MKTKLLLFAAVFMVSSAFSKPNEEALRTSYQLSVQLQPDSGSIHGVARIDHPGDSVFYLTKGLMIQSVIVDGKAIHFQQKAAGANDFSNEYRIDSLPRIMTVYFSGRIRPEDFPKTISTMNMMTSEVVELTDVIDWFPRMKTSGPFTYVLQAEAPSKFGLITNGSNINETESKGWRRITAQSLKPGYGISLLGSPGLKKSSLESDGYSIEIFYNKLPGSYVDSMKVDLLKTLQFYHQLYGSPGAHHLVRIIYSPRPAGGYARGSIIVVSEKYAVEQRLLKYGYARDFRLNAHEIAHFWSKANTSTPDDWINEGFAEFSALLATEKFVGNSFADVLTDEYRGIVENTKTQTAIVETSNDSWEREVNRYYKPALMFIEMRKKYGDEKLKQFFTDLCTRCDEGRSATTELILDVVEKNLGSEAKDYLNETLHRKVWNINSSEKKSVSVVDSTLIGTWSGPLTQFGATTKFVLHIAVKDGIVVPTLDSPDQNAFGIALSDFLQNNASISFKLGIASAVFHGIVDRNTKIITGVWTQRGVDYTLNLSKQ